jgi:fimbrial chaperone protein
LRRALVIKFLSVIIILLPSFVTAGSFKAVPVKLYLDARSRTEVLKITNEGNEKVTVQLNAKEWTQDEQGQDVYEDTKDIVFFPMIADIEKGEERIIRVGYQGQKQMQEEKTYRLFVEELPVSKPGEMALKFALKLGIPIFIQPLKETVAWSINGVDLSKGRLTVKVKNSGNTHFVVNTIKAVGLDGSGKEVFSRYINGWYTLAGVSKPFGMTVSYEECMNSRVPGGKEECVRLSMGKNISYKHFPGPHVPFCVSLVITCIGQGNRSDEGHREHGR